MVVVDSPVPRGPHREQLSRDWFQARKGEYDRLLKEPLATLCVALDGAFRARGIALEADPTRSPFRIYRDVRFSKDESPHHDKVRTGKEGALRGVYVARCIPEQKLRLGHR